MQLWGLQVVYTREFRDDGVRGTGAEKLNEVSRLSNEIQEGW